MHSVTLDSSGSPRKRTFSRGLSEDESLRSIIKEADSSSRRVTRSDSRAGTLKRRTDSQSEQDLFMGHTEMLELQTSYDEVVQELRGLEVERETLLFQVDVLQDTLESVEELLAEAQREAGQASSELEREKEAKRKLESMVNSLMQEVERLNEESNNKPSALADTHRSVDEETAQGLQTKNDVTDLTSDERRATEEEVGQSEEADEEGSLLTKVRKMVITASGHIPSLSLHNPGSEDGVLLRPCGNGLEDGPDTNDSDSISAYEDACAETPELDRIFSGEADTMELPDDLESKEGALTNSCQLNDGVTEESKNPDQCVMC